MIIHIYIYIHIYIHRVERESTIIIVGLRGLQRGRRGKENDRENNIEIHCIAKCTESC
jgi:hypothetical protein